MTRATPTTTWLARNETASIPWIIEKAAAARTATTRPANGLPVLVVTQNPVTAPISMVPSTPRSRTPLRWVRIAPVPARTTGVPEDTATTRDWIRTQSFIGCPPQLG